MSTISHTGCTVNGNTLVGCPLGGGTLTITGQYFYGANPATVVVNAGCNGALTIDAAFDQITCALAAGAAGTNTGNIVVTTNGGSTTATGRIVYYGKIAFACFHDTDNTVNDFTHLLLIGAVRCV